jgi:Tfp pilus assembly protein PilO
MRQLVPAANEVTTLLDQVSSSARRVGLDVSKIEPLGTETGQDFIAYKYRFSMNGSYHAVAEFLTNVGSLRRIVVPVNVNMVTSQAQSPGAARSTTTTFELHTYVANTNPPPPPKPKSAAAAAAAPAKGGE